MWARQVRVRSRLAVRYLRPSARQPATAPVVKNVVKTRPNLATPAELQIAVAQGNEMPSLEFVELTKQSKTQPLAHQPGEWQRATLLLSRVPEGTEYKIGGQEFQLEVFSHDYTDGRQGPPVELRLRQNGEVVSRRILQRDGMVHKADLHPHLAAQVAAAMHDQLVQLEDMSVDDQNVLRSARAFALRNNKLKSGSPGHFVAKRQYQGGAVRMVVETYRHYGSQNVDMAIMARTDEGYQQIGVVRLVDNQIVEAVRPELVARYLHASLLREQNRSATAAVDGEVAAAGNE
jgi:hypothetical protein